MDQSREKLQERIKRLTDRNQQELLRDIVDSTWQWSSGSTNHAVQERWITVGGQTVRGTTAQEKAPATTGGQTDGQGQTESQTAGAKGEVGPAGPKGDVGPQGDVGLTGPAGKDGTQGPGVTGSQLADIVTTAGPTFTIPAFDVRLFDTTDFLGEIDTFSFASQAISIPDDGTLRYVCAYRSGASASIVFKTQAEVYSINFSNTIPLWRVARYGSMIHQTNYDNAGDGLADKQEFMLLRTQPYRITYEGGLAGSLNGRALSLTGAKVFFGHRLMDVLPFSSAEGKVTAWYHSAGEWASSVIANGLFPNSKYDNGTNLVNFSNSSKWGAVFVYRTVGDDKEVFYVYGRSESSNLAGAELIPVPPTPDLVQWHSILVGKILFHNGALSGTWEQYSTVTFQQAAVTNHSNLSGLVGTGPEYNHLNNAQSLGLLTGVDTALHWHSADRDRGSHTGTQLASTVSDFSAAADARITLQKGVANGVATLDSNVKIPLAQIPDALIGQVKFQSLWDQTTNSPALPSTPGAGTKGYYWICTDAAQATFQGLVLNTGDWLIVNGNEGSLSWGKVDNTDSVTSVFGRIGSITAQAVDYASFYQPLGNYVTTDTNQTIAGVTKTFTYSSTYGESVLGSMKIEPNTNNGSCIQWRSKDGVIVSGLYSTGAIFYKTYSTEYYSVDVTGIHGGGPNGSFFQATLGAVSGSYNGYSMYLGSGLNVTKTSNGNYVAANPDTGFTHLINGKTAARFSYDSVSSGAMSCAGEGATSTSIFYGSWSCWGVTPPSSRPTVNAPAVSSGDAVPLVNQIRLALIACGIIQ